MFSRKIAASAAAVALAATGLVACSNDDDTAAETEVVEATATETNVETETAAEDTETASAEASATDSAGAAGEGAEATEEITTADGGTAMVPAGVVAAMDKFAEPSWGEPMKVEQVDEGWIVTYDQEHYVTWNENTGGAPTWGQIANEWMTDVNVDKKLGFPLAPEAANPDESGWTQEFERGSINWTRAGEGEPFAAVITEK
ncbi:hypothetical protein CYJ46_08985 [Corynebacterium coyleae]|uniref:hypothetical protein n=1 Tax=Corynebacterium coyleae TaxID=53374 RepID=UPI000C76FC98|nr:hypothetical protein [Corynebacterium coyleae]PLA37334.1 hypothetical protein CYJ46_08985 [Corynebacterium coyleae]